jgi:hypothetical protein
VIPGTLLGALFLAACLVPGFVFLRIGERRRARLTRSALLEAVELAGVGATASLVSVMAVLSLGRWWEFLDTSALADDPARYLLTQPLPGLGSLLGIIALSCALASLAALVVFVTRESVFEPSGSTWVRAFYEDRPPDKPTVMATIELTDGRLLAGPVRSFSAQLDENRELALGAPLAASAGAGEPLSPVGGDFIVVREKQIAAITGRYLDPAQPEPAEGS